MRVTFLLELKEDGTFTYTCVPALNPAVYPEEVLAEIQPEANERPADEQSSGRAPVGRSYRGKWGFKGGTLRFERDKPPPYDYMDRLLVARATHQGDSIQIESAAGGLPPEFWGNRRLYRLRRLPGEEDER